MLTAASSRNLDKGGYIVKDAAVRRDVKVSAEDCAGLGSSMLRVVAAEGALKSSRTRHGRRLRGAPWIHGGKRRLLVG